MRGNSPSFSPGRTLFLCRLSARLNTRKEAVGSAPQGPWFLTLSFFFARACRTNSRHSLSAQARFFHVPLSPPAPPAAFFVFLCSLFFHLMAFAPPNLRVVVSLGTPAFIRPKFSTVAFRTGGVLVSFLTATEPPSRQVFPLSQAP